VNHDGCGVEGNAVNLVTEIKKHHASCALRAGIESGQPSF